MSLAPRQDQGYKAADTQFCYAIMESAGIDQLGRACVRLIDAADERMAQNLNTDERLASNKARRLARKQLRHILADASPDITMKITIESARLLGVVKEVTLN